MPASGSFLLDTNIIIHLLSRDEVVVARTQDASEILIPIIAIGELFFGASKSSRPKENKIRIQELAAQNSVLLCDFEVAREYGEIKQELRALGKPIPENDIWIAAIARRWELSLVTRDRHFQGIQRLQIAAW